MITYLKVLSNAAANTGISKRLLPFFFQNCHKHFQVIAKYKPNSELNQNYEGDPRLYFFLGPFCRTGFYASLLREVLITAVEL